MTDDVLERIRLSAQAELAREPVARPWWKDALLLVGVNAVAVIGCSLAIGWRDVGRVIGLLANGDAAGAAALLVGGAPLLALAVAGAYAAVRPGRGGWIAGVLALSATSAAALVLWSHAGDEGSRSVVSAGVPCLVTQVVMAILPSLAALTVLRSFACSPARMFVAALSAGAAGLFALHLHCPIGTPLHLFAFHLSPWIAVGLVVVLARRWMRSKSLAP